MAKAEVLCPNCGTSFKVCDCVNSKTTISELKDGKYYLVSETIRNENVKNAKTEVRMAALEAAGINVNKLQTLMEKDESLKDIFSSDDPIVKELSKGGFINNPELFRRWITAQSWRLIKDPKGWTHAVRQRYDANYAFKQTRRELNLLCKLQKKCPNDLRFNFFTLTDLKRIFVHFMKYNRYYYNQNKEYMINGINSRKSYVELRDYINGLSWCIDANASIPSTWLNCFKGAGAYYTLQNLVRTHGLILPKCKDMNDSLEAVEVVFKDIIGYEPYHRRWDILMSLLMKAVNDTGFELKY